MEDNWRLIKSEEKFKDPVLRVEHREFYYKRNDSHGTFTVISMKDWGVVVPVTIEGKMVLVKQYRVGSCDAAYEFPGGALEVGEDPTSGSARELSEETGYEGELTFLSKMRPNPAFMDNFCYLYLAEKCEKTSELLLDPFEDLEPVEFDVSEVEQMILDGRIVHSISIAAYGAYRAFLTQK
ncbi:MAG: NUDIX domain-containing protein [Denitrovibrio sp.]|nr:MAG: NUDIX domain-containing protein [Denitrovibrio sp.]